MIIKREDEKDQQIIMFRLTEPDAEKRIIKMGKKIADALGIEFVNRLSSEREADENESVEEGNEDQEATQIKKLSEEEGEDIKGLIKQAEEALRDAEEHEAKASKLRKAADDYIKAAELSVKKAKLEKS